MWDPAVRTAIGKKLRGRSETDREALRVIDVLTVTHARSLDGVEACEGLRILVLVGCELDTLERASELPSLGMVVVSDSVIKTIDHLAGLNLHTVHAERTEILDLSPLLACSGLVDVALSGSAISEDSYRSVISGLEAAGCDVTPPDAIEREVTARLRGRGLKMNCYRFGSGYRICRPGLMFTDRPEANHPEVDLDALRRMMDSDPEGVTALFDRRA
ncbi:hypothetical protein ABZ621_01540 [Streptomyces sp. NPDC007863]|uniref:hypothetical protein n=1 Tax=Streptomyces sp. NPDC007863 TaxID=3154894 RepID=UPI0033C27122